MACFICYTGPVAEGERLLAPIKRLGRPVGDVVQRRPYLTPAVSPRRHPAEGPAVLLEIGVPPGTRGRAAGRARGGTPSASSRRIHWSSSFLCTGRSTGSHRTIPRSATGTPAPSFNIARLVGAPRRRRGEHRLGPGGVGRPAPVLDGRDLRQLPHRGGRERPHPRGVRPALRTARRGEGAVGPDEPVPPQQEHSTDSLSALPDLPSWAPVRARTGARPLGRA